jgi:hypothetical protein
MRMIYVLIMLLSLTVLLSAVKAGAENIPSDEAKRLEAFFRKTLDTKMPKDAKISVTGYQESAISGFKRGSFVIEASGKSGNIPFLISQDGRYIIIAESIDTKTFTDTGVGGLKRGAIPIGRQQIPVLISADGRYIMLGELIDFKAGTPN